MDTPLISGYLGAFDAFNVLLTIINAISKNLPSSGTKWLPIMTYIHPPGFVIVTYPSIFQKLVVKLSSTSTMLFPPVAKSETRIACCGHVW